MSGAKESRAAVFTTQPQDVEVYQAGAWWPGSLLGWRHDSAGDCQVWVRVVIGGVEETAWTDLTTLRLPERSSQSPLALAPSLSATEQLKVVAGRVPVPPPGGGPPARAAAVAETSAAASAETLPPGGRRRAPEPATAEFTLSEAPTGVAAPGRHRPAGMPGPAVPGRHRASDTGMWPAGGGRASEGDATGRMSGPADAPQLVATAVSAGGGRRRADRVGGGVPASSWAARPPVEGAPSRSTRRDPEPDLLTRPMRLDDLAGQSRGKPRLDGFLSKA